MCQNARHCVNSYPRTWIITAGRQGWRLQLDLTPFQLPLILRDRGMRGGRFAHRPIVVYLLIFGAFGGIHASALNHAFCFLRDAGT
jgi:hypothetical protein